MTEPIQEAPEQVPAASMGPQEEAAVTPEVPAAPPADAPAPADSTDPAVEPDPDPVEDIPAVAAPAARPLPDEDSLSGCMDY